MIDNFNVIENFMQFEKGTFYKFECLVRNTDGDNILYEQGYSKTNKNILVKSWYVDNNIHGLTDTLCDMIQGKEIGIKPLSKMFASKTSVKETSDKKTKTIMFDVDTKDNRYLNAICEYIKYKKQEPFILETKKGYHVFCYKKFDHSNWRIFCNTDATYWQDNPEEKYFYVDEYISVKDNELGLVYHPTAHIQKD